MDATTENKLLEISAKKALASETTGVPYSAFVGLNLISKLKHDVEVIKRRN